VQLIAQLGQPALNRHSLQVEIRRPLYMDEATRERNAGFAPLQADLSDVLAQVAAYVRARQAALA
jgi:N-formylglutamate amidohydrolase